MAKAKAAHHRGDYQARAAKVRAWAYANPDTRCGRCGKTLDQHPPGDRWEAGHVNDGEVGGPLRPEGRSCNRRAAAQRTNAKRQARVPRHTVAEW